MAPLGNVSNTLNASRIPQRVVPYKKPELVRTNSRESQLSYPSLSNEEFLARKKDFTTYKFFLDSLEPNMKKRIERGIKLLGAEQELFFSKNCTHVITTKPIPHYDNLLQQRNNDTNHTNQSKKTNPGAKDNIVDNAIQWNKVLWSVDVMTKTIDYFLQSNSGSRKETQEKRALGKALQEEKLFGPSTGVNNDAQTKRPQFMPFSGYFLMVEDVNQAHRPPVLRQFTKKVQKMQEYPWPTLSRTAKFKSPFSKKPPPPPPTNTHNTNDEPKEKVNINNDDDDKENIDPNAVPLNMDDQEENKDTPSAPLPPPPSSSAKQAPAAALQGENAIRTPADSQQFSLRASGFQPYTNTVQSVSTRSVMQGEMRRLPPGDNITRLDKRVIENVAQTKKQEQQLRQQQQQQQKRKKDARYCENCNMLFESLEEHYKEKTHQTFIRDPNNFSQLDILFEKTRRVYKQPLPEHMRPLIDTNIDGKNVVFTGIKRGHPSPDSSNTNKKQRVQEPQIADNKGWSQYGDVFL